MPANRSLLSLFRLLALTMTAAALTAACGGGVGTGGTGTYAAGPITGFGSIVVNGIRFDDSAATVEDDEGNARPRADLRLGMTVEVDAGALATAAQGKTATATRVRIGSEIMGPVQAIDATAGTLTVLGQTVRVAVETVFDDRLTRGLASLRVGEAVQVYGEFDAARAGVNATRIEPRVVVLNWWLRAPVDAVDAGSQTLRVGGATFAYGAANGIPSGLQPGQRVLMRLATSLDGSDRFVVRGFGRALSVPQDRDDVSLSGRVSGVGAALQFELNGVPVDASAASFPKGSAGLVIGARVEVDGSTVAGVVRASVVEVESDNDVRERGFELKGEIEALDTAARTFRLRGLTVGYARPDLRVDDGTLADLAVGREVEVRAQLAADRISLEATRIKFE